MRTDSVIKIILCLCFIITIGNGYAGAVDTELDSESIQAFADMIITNGKIATMNEKGDFVEAVAIKDGKFLSVGTTGEINEYKGDDTIIIDAEGMTVIPGLNDSHAHHVRAGLNYNLELRWDGVPSLEKGLAMISEQAKRTPKGEWIRVVGGWSEYQFVEKRMPTLEEINKAAPGTPVFVMYLYGLGYLNKAGVKALGYDKNTKYPGGIIELDDTGEPTGLLIAKPSALVLYSTLSKMPKLTQEQQKNSSIQYFRELNRLGLTSSIDAGGGGQFYPDSYEVAETLAKEGKLPMRISYHLFAQKKGEELKSFQEWVKVADLNKNDSMLKPNGYTVEGGGENLTWAAADFENFLEPRPELGQDMGKELKPIVQLFAENGWPFRIHATYGASISQMLDVFEEVNRETPFKGRCIIDHAETVADKELERIKALGCGIAVQNRMFFQGEHFIERYGKEAASTAPPVKKMLNMGIPVGLGTDSTRVSSYNPWLSLYWIVSGKTWGGTQMYPQENRLDREQALRLMTEGSAWFSDEEDVKGQIAPGKLADVVILSHDYFSVPEDQIKDIESLLTIVGGKPAYATGKYKNLSPELPQISLDWSPVTQFGGYYSSDRKSN
jgi:predicted amidohydrolase YtcJ